MEILTPVLGLAIALAIGLLLTRVVRLFGIPNVTGFLIAGIIVGPSALKILKGDWISQISILIEIALGFIAFSIGGEFKISTLKKLGGKVTVITILQAVGAVVFVALSLLTVHYIKPELIGIPEVLLLSAIATATAPAATLLVVRQYKARGPLVDTLLPVVAFDDAIGLVFFAILFGIARVIKSGAEITFMSMVLLPLKEVVLSLAVGFGLGLILSLATTFFKSRANRISWTVATVLAAVALSEVLELSALLTCMMLGATFTNSQKESYKVLEQSERWTPPIYVLFFVISGATLDLKVIPAIGVIGIVYILFRSLGKYLGAAAAGKMVKAHKSVTKYIGFALLPQAGVAIGMVQLVASEPAFAGEIAKSLTTVVLCATLIYELFGPLLTKFALRRAGELTESGSLLIVDYYRSIKGKIKARKAGKEIPEDDSPEPSLFGEEPAKPYDVYKDDCPLEKAKGAEAEGEQCSESSRPSFSEVVERTRKDRGLPIEGESDGACDCEKTDDAGPKDE